jgi:hypothetical protein
MDCIPSGDSAMLEADHNFPLVTNTTAYTPTPSPRAVPAALDPPLPVLACMWGDCGASFQSLSGLAEHVNLVHLCHPPTPSPLATSESRDPCSMSCQWKNCNIYPTPDLVPGPSSGDIDSTLCVLSSHLLHDHLGLPPCFHGPHSAELLQPESHHSAHEPTVSSALPPEDDGPAGHVCCWSSCGQSFGSLDDLTQHLTDTHVGSGKTSYDCYWQDCPRHGESGFTSKQKLCRHLQVRTFVSFFFIRLYLSSRIRATGHSSAKSACKTSPRLPRCNSTCDGTRRKVSIYAETPLGHP